jgi:SAM-dependent methyltransferase
VFVQYRPGKDVWAFGVEPAKVKYRLRLARYPALAEYLAQWLHDRADTDKLTLVDIGVGFGRTFLYVEAQGLADRFDFIGLDIAPERHGDVYANNPWDIRQGDAQESLEFADSSVDVVVCEQLLEHLEYPEKCIAEIKRVLKEDGLFVCGVPTFPEPIAKFRRWRVGRYGLGGSEHIQTYSLAAIRKALADDFDEVGVRGFRIISGGVLRWLENHFWWYRFNRWLGSVLPRLCIEIQLLMVPKA